MRQALPVASAQGIGQGLEAESVQDQSVVFDLPQKLALFLVQDQRLRIRARTSIAG